MSGRDVLELVLLLSIISGAGWILDYLLRKLKR